MDSRDQPPGRLWQIGPGMNSIQDRVRDPRIQQHLGQVVRGVLPGGGPRHEYHRNPYLGHLYNSLDRDEVDGPPEGTNERSHEHVLSLEDLDTQLQEVLSQASIQDNQTGDNGAGHGHSHGPSPQGPQVNAQDWKVILGSVSFAIILFLRLMADHILGLLVFVALSAVFYYANLKMIEIVHITSLRDHQSKMRTVLSSMWLAMFLTVNIACIYWFFEDQHLWRVLYFQLPSDWQGSLFTLFWVTMVTDYILRYGTIALKSLISVAPSFCLLQKKKGKYYMFVETLSQLYRSVVPVIPWIHFLYDQPKSGKLIFAAILVVVYIVLKLWRLFMDYMKLQKAVRIIRTDTKYGVQPTAEEIKSQCSECPICQEDYQDPVMLSCKHIFCENCVSIWFDREKTCPMCRAQIQANSPEWQDGSTSAHLQWY